MKTVKQIKLERWKRKEIRATFKNAYNLKHEWALREARRIGIPK